tara:strand:+ start:222 stop:446 length:225 start_codon:yes stop_codon:yes gene_type:complete
MDEVEGLNGGGVVEGEELDGIEVDEHDDAEESSRVHPSRESYTGPPLTEEMAAIVIQKYWRGSRGRKAFNQRST